MRTAALDPEDQELLKNLKICLPVLHKTIVFTMEDLSSLEKVEENKLKTIALIVSYAFASIGDLSFAVVRLLRYVLTMKDTELATPASFSVPTAVSDVWRACKQWLSWS